jgi:hypothetical protein
MRKLFLAGALLAQAAGTASAASFTIDSTNCASVQSSGNCYGLKYILNIDPAGGTNYKASLEITDDSGLPEFNFAGAGISFISAVDFKGANGVTSMLLTDAPGGTAGWTTSEHKADNAGCSAPGNGFICSEDVPAVTLAPVTVVTGSTPGSLVWKWDFSSTTAPVLAHIGAKFDNATGTLNGQILSASLPGDGGGGDEGGTQSPEPATLALFGLALAGFASRLRKRMLE